MTCSLIITTFLRSHLLKWNLRFIAHQKIPFDYEILIINDGQDDETEDICDMAKMLDHLPIQYIFTGQRNTKELVWRAPAKAINVGIKQAKGDFVIISCAEILSLGNTLKDIIEPLQENSKLISICEGKDDRTGEFLYKLQEHNGDYNKIDYDNIEHKLTTEFPFFLGLSREVALDIGGYDEEYCNVYCWDDKDFVDRLIDNGLKYHIGETNIVHLYHPRTRIGMTEEEQKKKWQLAKEYYEKNKGIVKRNVDKEWGTV